MFPGPKFVISISVRHSLLLAHLHGLDGLEVLVQLIVEGDPSWQVDAHDLLVRHAFKVLDNAERELPACCRGRQSGSSCQP